MRMYNAANRAESKSAETARRKTIWLALAAGALLLAGCDDSAKQQTKVHAPATTPAPVPQYVREPLPFPGKPLNLTALEPGPRPAIYVLVEKVRKTFEAG